MWELGGAHFCEGNLEIRSTYMGEAGFENKGHNLSNYDKVSMVSKTREFLPLPLL